MAAQQLSGRRPALTLIHGSSAGITQVREYQPDRYTIVGNHLAQHSELSLLTIGLGTYIQSLPDGALVDIRTLARRFPEGRDRIAAALRELEAHGYIERIRERTPDGRLVTRTFVYNAPELTRARLAREAAEPPAAAPETPVVPAPGPPPAEKPTPPPLPEPETSTPEADDAAASLLAGLRRDDPRLLLPERDVRRLTPAVVAWLERGVPPEIVRRTLASDLPPALRNPYGLLAHRLTALLPPPLPPAPAQAPPPLPMHNCDACERVIRSPAPGLCRDCRETGDASASAA